MCYCSIDDAPTIYWESRPVARKTHICCECGSEIDPGEKYYRIAGVWNGIFTTFKQCQICDNVWIEAMAEGLECICFGELWETVGSEYEYAAV
jgi:hypothetical protein